MARKILLADDSVTAQNMGRKILADAGYEVITVNNGSAALKKITEARPDLIVLDVYMPGYSGLEVCQRLKENGDTARIPVLLTVGKLEPFKPEEAKRVRAEGFIVKPFEASELLSALTKLEDKMVPRSESSKPGRFARTIAVVEEDRYDKTMAANEDSGWKNRISFPSKKKGKAAEAEDDDSAIYNPVNKDLRTVVETKPTPIPEAKVREAKTENRVDLTALAPEGLPKDVTPEEIAALAAAAAQMQGKIAEAKSTETKIAEIEETKVDQRQSGDTKTAGIKAAEPIAEQASAIAQPEKPEQKEEEKNETKSEIQLSEPAATFAEQKPEEQKKEKKTESVSDVPSIPGPTTTEVVAAINALETPGPVAPASSFSSGEIPNDRSRQTEPEPVTMALAAAAAQGTAGSRWTAVAVAVAPEESAIVLEDEMRKAYAAYAANVGAESHSAPAEPASGTQPNSETATSAPPAASVAAISSAEPAQPVQAAMDAESEVAHSASTAMSAVSEEISAHVKSFETVAASAVEAAPVHSAEPVTGQTSESVTPASETPQPIESKSTETHTEEIAAAQGAISEPPAAEMAPLASEPQKYEEPVDAKEEHHEEPVPPVTAAAAVESAANSVQTPVEAVPANEAAISPAVAEAATSNDPASKAKHDAPSKESDIAATTAAAWASWRRIRESDSKEAGSSLRKPEEQSSNAHDEAAMAVAAGAEKAPEEGPEIASIVDSVLADLRPKIVEEISKKLKKK